LTAAADIPGDALVGVDDGRGNLQRFWIEWD
jgi:hypothetical protein